MRSYLVVANQTLAGEHLIARVRQCMAEGSCRFYLVVPATPPSELVTWTEGEARAIARGRLEAAFTRFREIGAEVEGEVGDANPMLAIEDALRGQNFDEMILSTLPPGVSRWLKRDLPSRVANRFPLPVTHLIGEPEPPAPNRPV